MSELLTPDAPDERRRWRSDEPAAALWFFLTMQRRRGRHHTVAVADACGRLLAGVGEDKAWIAAAAPATHARPESQREGLLGALLGDRALHVWHVQDPQSDQGCYFAAVGGADTWPATVQAALQRILFRAPTPA